MSAHDDEFERVKISGDAILLRKTGIRYSKGDGLEKSYEKARILLETASELGDLWAQSELADWYRDGEHFSQDPVKAFKLYKKTAEQDFVYSMSELADCYANGFGTEPDETEAFSWYLKAAYKDNSYACGRVAKWLQSGRVKKNVSAALGFYLKGASLGSWLCNAEIADMYAKGGFLKKNLSEASRLFELGAQAGHAYSTFRLGQLTVRGARTEVPATAGIELLKQAADSGQSGAWNELGKLYRDGGIVSSNHEYAFECFKSAAQLNNATGYFELAKAFYLGRGTKRSAKQARECFANSNSLSPTWYETAFEILCLYQRDGTIRKGQAQKLLDSEVFSGNFNKTLMGALRRLVLALEDGWQLTESTPLLTGDYADFVDAAIIRPQEGWITCLFLKPYEGEEADIEYQMSNDHSLLADYSFVAGRVLSALGLPDASAWNGIMMMAEARALGPTFSDFCKSSAAVGIVYNQLTPLGTPIPGYIRPRMEGDYAGLGKLEGISASRSGLSLVGSPSSQDELPMIVDEDLDVAIALAFSSSTPLDASFSLEKHRKLTPEYRSYSRIDVQQFSPSWLGATEAGKSLYYADHLMKSMDMRDGFMSLFDPTISSSLDPHFEIPTIVKELDKRKYGDYDDMGGRHAIMLKSIEYDIRPRRLKSQSDVILSDIDVFIDGSYIKYDENGDEDRSVSRNDPNTSVGKWGDFFTANYEDISALFPVFERVRQVLALFKLVAVAREKGVINPQILQRQAQATVEHFSSMMSDKKILAPKPWHCGGCWCEGGVSMSGAQAHQRNATDARKLPVGGTPYSIARDLGGLRERSIAMVGRREATNVLAVKTSSNRAMLVAADGYTGYAQALRDVQPSHENSQKDADHVVASKSRQAADLKFVAIASVPKEINRGHGATFEKTASPLRVDANGKIWMSNHQAAKLAGLAPEEVKGVRYARDQESNDVFQAGMSVSQREDIQKALTFEISEVSKPLTWLSALQAEFKVNS